MSCSPKFSDNKGSCYSLKDLQEIAKNYNRENSSNKIKLNQTKEKLYNAILKANYDKCGDNEFCWLKQNYMEINKDINKFLVKFRPVQPNTWENEPKKWLNTYNLLDVMSQYEEKHKNFKFLGASPILKWLIKLINFTRIDDIK